jgi:hypothetical protein
MWLTILSYLMIRTSTQKTEKDICIHDNAQELVKLVREMDQGEKDKVIQDIFMNKDFAWALT